MRTHPPPIRAPTQSVGAKTIAHTESIIQIQNLKGGILKRGFRHNSQKSCVGYCVQYALKSTKPYF
jgi:hypothetical protein